MRAVGLAALPLLMASTACGGESDSPPAEPSTSPTPDTFLLEGSVTVDTSVNEDGTEGSPCRGRDGFDDLAEGARIVVRDADGTTVAAGTLGPGTAVADGTGNFSDCSLPMNVGQVPDGSKFYTVQIADRNELTYPREELDAPIELNI